MRTFVVHVRQDQLDAAKEWYTQFAGVAPYFDQPFYVGCDVGGFELGITPDGDPGPGGSVAYWGTTDIVAEVERASTLGANIAEAVHDVGEQIQVATIADPFGNLVGIIQNPHFNPRAVK